MAIPPPPPGPPGPPPPPIGNLKLAAPIFGKMFEVSYIKKKLINSSHSKTKDHLLILAGKSSGNGGDQRSALLLSIQKGAKLKKTTTIDKSEPIGAGRIADANGNNVRINSGAPSRPPPPNNGSAQTNGTPKLKGIFEGMQTMPKLKSVGGKSKWLNQLQYTS